MYRYWDYCYFQFGAKQFNHYIKSFSLCHHYYKSLDEYKHSMEQNRLFASVIGFIRGDGTDLCGAKRSATAAVTQCSSRTAGGEYSSPWGAECGRARGGGGRCARRAGCARLSAVTASTPFSTSRTSIKPSFDTQPFLY